MKNSTTLAICLASLCATAVVYAWDVNRADTQYTGVNVIDTGGIIDVKGTLKINGTAVTSTAAELNILDGVTANAAQINAASGTIGPAGISLTNSSDNGTCFIKFMADKGDDLGDALQLLVGASGGLVIGTDTAVSGTYATKFTLSSAGLLTLVGSATIDNTASTDLIFTETNIRNIGNNFMSGTLSVTGAVSALGAANVVGGATLQSTLGVAGASFITNSLTVGTNLLVNGTGRVVGNVTMAGTLGIAGATALTGAVSTVTHATVGGNLLVTGTGSITGAVEVIGALTATLPVQTVVNMTATNRTCTSADYGKLIIINTNDVVLITLPANGAAAGSTIDFMIKGSNDCAPTISAATTDTLVGFNSAGLKSITYGTGHRIGAYCRFISDGAFWHVFNLSSANTMTLNE
jgi:hypothetical protein